MAAVAFTLSFAGDLAEAHALDFYDAARALTGFQRSLALTTHLILNGEIITQAPSLEGAQILLVPPEAGSWKATAQVALLSSALYSLGTAPQDTALGNMVTSAYDYVVSETLGFHVDFDKTLGQQIEELRKKDAALPPLPQARFDSLIEKCEPAIKEMHRPLVESETASLARLSARVGPLTHPFKHPLTVETYEYIDVTRRSEQPIEFEGRVSSYNMNTFKGRMYLEVEHRPIPFTLAESVRNSATVSQITESLSANAVSRKAEEGNISFGAFTETSKTGRLKRLYIVELYE